MHSANEKGFGLIEVLIIILLAGVIAAILIPKQKMDQKAMFQEQSRANMQTLDSAMQLYYNQNRSYTDDMDLLFSLLGGREVLCPDDSTQYELIAKDSTYYLIYDPHGYGVIDNGHPSWLRR